MVFSSLIRTLGRSPLTTEVIAKLQRYQHLRLEGLSRLAKGLVASTLAQSENRHLLVITATLEEASRWTAQLEIMGWQTVHFYPTSEASPDSPLPPESELTWGQMQVLADLALKNEDDQSKDKDYPKMAIVATERSLQPFLPPPEVFQNYCLKLEKGEIYHLKDFARQLVTLGYERVPLVETEGQWSQRGDLIDIFPVAAELPARLEWFGDQLEQIREFDPATQRSLDKIEQLILTPTNFAPLIAEALGAENLPETENLNQFMGLAFPKPAALTDYLPANTIIALDEPEQCQAHSDRWVESEETRGHGDAGTRRWEEGDGSLNDKQIIPIHRWFTDSLEDIKRFWRLDLSELAISSSAVVNPAINLASRSIPTTPHQYAKVAELLRQERDRRFGIWVVSAQPSRSVSLLQEHDCPAQFVPNPRDYPAIDKLQIQHVPIALKYSGLAELEGFILPTYRVVVITDREFFGQHSLATPSYIRKRRKAASKQVDPQKLRPGDYVVHRKYGIGKFLKLESISLSPGIAGDYLAIQYADGTLRVPADRVGSLSRFRTPGDGKPPELNKMTGNAWEKTKTRVRKAIKKVAFDLLQLYAQRAQREGFSYPVDSPWQLELEDSFPYQPTPDQLKAVQEVKRDMESDRPMDRLVCGDVGFGKTEVAIRAIFKAAISGKQVALLAPTTILTQQHYHTIKERFAPYPINIGLLNRFRTPQERKDIIQRLKTGELDVVVGTHQLLGKEVTFKELGLLVIDEEQRFGVNQKEKIKSFKTQIDVLTLSATPIPRTLYMSLSGVREMSLITTPPPSRRPIQTHLSPYNLEVVRTAIRQELDRGGQIFYVVPRVEGIEETSTKLRELVPGCRLAIAHGQLDPAELEAIMLAFSSGEADVLVCTTIVESGLDIPRVNTILIEDAHRFGLSQLYQLRGRVGRSGIQAQAWLFYPPKVQLSEAARQRLRAIQEFTQLGSGYQLATRDMEIRGVGNLLGAEQSGQMETIGFDLYVEMLQDAIKEIRAQEIPEVEETEIDLPLTAFIPADYIPDLDQKMSAYRAIATATTEAEVTNVTAELRDRYGELPLATQQLLKVIELKLLAKKIGISRIKLESKQHIILETPMEEPAWKLLWANLPSKLQTRFVYSPGKVTVRGLGVLKPQQQLTTLIEAFHHCQDTLLERDSLSHVT
jgi:transcription-repair coupling factor (superfamily II helicase)